MPRKRANKSITGDSQRKKARMRYQDSLKLNKQSTNIVNSVSANVSEIINNPSNITVRGSSFKADISANMNEGVASATVAHLATTSSLTICERCTVEDAETCEHLLNTHSNTVLSKKRYKSGRCGTATIAIEEHKCGPMDQVCSKCKGKFFNLEKTTRGTYLHCCHNGLVDRAFFGNYPDFMQKLAEGRHKYSAHYLANIRTYNSALSFASMGADFEAPPGTGPFSYRIHGQVYHRISSMHPPDTAQPKYAQLYVLNSETALRQRMNLSANAKCNTEVMKQLDLEIRKVNPYANAYNNLAQFEADIISKHGTQAAEDIRMYIRDTNPTSQQHKGRFNAPKASEIAVIFASPDGEPPSNAHICIHPKGQPLIRINTINANCDPMSYVLFFPNGEQGCGVTDPYTQLQLYSYLMHTRDNVFNPILHGKTLFQQYLVDSYAKVEGSRLKYIRDNQRSLRVESYLGLIDYVNSEASRKNVKAGNITILPSTFSCGPRAMAQSFQDAMSLVKQYSVPDIFLTLTTNVKWKEITDNLLPGQTASDRPDLVSRVFDMKKKAMLKEIIKDGIFGKIIAYVYVIEYQKRGLPHMHALFFLSDEDKIRDAKTIDSMISAQIPDPTIDPELYEIIKSTMVHGPCGALNKKSVCMENNVCTKRYPKDFCAETKINNNGYPQYKRDKDSKHRFFIKNNEIDDRWIIPYSPYLSKKYNCHVNVELCSSIKSVKYIFKYIYKGYDCANIKFDSNNNGTLVWDEINSFLSARYLSAPEAAWRLLQKPMHDKSHTVIRLQIHIPLHQLVYFHDQAEQQAVEKASLRHTQLTGWFQLNASDPHANEYLYSQIPYHYLWEKNVWQRRIMSAGHIISRIFNVCPKESERYHLRILLGHVRGAKSFQDVRSVNGVVYETFKDACRARGLLQDDTEWVNALKDASIHQMASELRQLFVFICVFCNPTSALDLFQKFKLNFAEDYLRSNSEDESIRLVLVHIHKLLQIHNYTLEMLQLPIPSHYETNSAFNEYNVEEESQHGREMQAMLNFEQLNIFNTIMAAVTSTDEGVKAFCVNAFAGAGKSFLFNTILHAVRGLGKVAIPVAWTGIAATLLKGGRTVCSTFKLPIPVTETASCRIKYNSDQRKKLEMASIVLWDECTVSPKHSLNAVDNYFRDIMNNDIPFGGKVMLLGGDWRQILPIATNADKASIVENCLKYCNTWGVFKQFSLKTNMQTLESQIQFADWLIKLGDGKLQPTDCIVPDNTIEIPSQCIINNSIIDEVFGTEINESNIATMANKSILCPTNEHAIRINEEVLSLIPGQTHSYFSADKIECDEDDDVSNYTMDFVNSLTPSGMPPHQLNLKPGVIVMLLRNINPTAGLCNGSRLIVKRLMANVIDAEILIGEHKGRRVFIPRMQLSPSDANLPFQLVRRQFPFRLSFAMTINKSQGQSLETVGIYLDRPVFSHGMLYVAFSRATSIDSVRVFVKPNEQQGQILESSSRHFTQNIVFHEVFKL